jgi:hypothetical protein
MPTASDRQKPWPRYAGQARQRAEETATNYAELLQQTLHMLERIQDVAYDDPAQVAQLAIQAQRDVALTIAALASIKTWMVEAKQGRERAEEGGGISQEQLCLSLPDEGKQA